MTSPTSPTSPTSLAARPATGTTFSTGGFGDVDNRFQEVRTGLVAVLVRDDRGAETDISPHNSDGTPRWSPLAKDGSLRADLFAHIRKDGQWITNPSPNLGFHLAGAFAEGNGPSTKPSLDSDEQMIEQTNTPFDVTLTKDDEPFSFTAVESGKPFLRRLRNNLRLTDGAGTGLVELPGGVDAGWAKPLDSDSIDRQVLLVSARKRAGRTQYTIDGYASNRLVDVGAARKGKKGEAAELTFKPIPNGYFRAKVDGEVMPIIKYTWVGGDGWTLLAPIVLTMSPATLSVTAATGAGQAKQLTVTDAAAVDRTSVATWTVADATKATVSAAGMVTGKAVGSTVVTASYGGGTATCAVTVT